MAVCRLLVVSAVVRLGTRRLKAVASVIRPAGLLAPQKTSTLLYAAVFNGTRLQKCSMHSSCLSCSLSRSVSLVERSCCSGCGVELQSRDKDGIGYIPEDVWEKKKIMSETEVGPATNPVCQRCFQLRHYSSALSVAVPESEYLHSLQTLKDKRALILLMLDVTDFPGSLFPNLSSLIRPGNPVIVVANKVDLLPSGSEVDKRRLEKHLREVAIGGSLHGCHLERVMFISAKQGTGVDVLTQTIVTSWGNRGDVFLLGCTNVGKSTLFNRLLVSLCGARPGHWSPANEMTAPSATISQWPGTTLDLLRFPIMSVGKRKRLIVQARKKGLYITPFGEEKIDYFTNWTFSSTRPTQDVAGKDLQFDDSESEIDEVLEEVGLKKLRKTTQPSDNQSSFIGSDSDNRVTRSATRPQHRFWLHDTPGAINSSQLINLLTQEELKLCLPQRPLVPRTFILKPGQTMLLGGLARMDYTEGSVSAYFSVFASAGIPVHVTQIDKAEMIYSRHLGEPLLMVPCGDTTRLNRFPPLLSEEHTLTGVGWKTSCADVVLSSAGWIGVTVGEEKEVTLRVFTPSGKGLFVRRPSLFPSAVTERGRRSLTGNRSSFTGRK